MIYVQRLSVLTPVFLFAHDLQAIPVLLPSTSTKLTPHMREAIRIIRINSCRLLPITTVCLGVHLGTLLTPPKKPTTDAQGAGITRAGPREATLWRGQMDMEWWEEGTRKQKRLDFSTIKSGKFLMMIVHQRCPPLELPAQQRASAFIHGRRLQVALPAQ